MKGPEWRRLVKPLLPADRDWGLTGSRFYVRPVRWVVVELVGEPSRWDSSMRVHQVLMPLFPEQQHGNAVFGRNSERFFEGEELRAAIVDMLDDVPSSDEALEVIAQAPLATRRAGPEHVAEYSGYSRIVLGDIAGAIERLRVAASSTDTREWAVARAERATEMIDLLESGDTETAMARLDAWADATAANLKIERTR